MFKSIRFKNAYFHTDDQNQRKWRSIKIDARATQICNYFSFPWKPLGTLYTFPHIFISSIAIQI